MTRLADKKKSSDIKKPLSAATESGRDSLIWKPMNMRTNLPQQAIQDNSNNDFLQGDTVVLIAPVTLVNRTFDTGDLLSVEYITPLGGIGVTTNGVIVVVVDPTEVRHATTLELKLKRRLTLAEQALAEVP